ncbi:MAG: fused MFS/spermidine synthase [Pseudomonadota bacterium]
MPRQFALYVLMTLSGFAGVGYEVVWSRMLTTALGHEIVAVLAVLAAFFAGLALGAWTFGGRIRRSDHPTRWYAGLEAAIGLWALALLALLPLVNELVPVLISTEAGSGRQWTVAFLATFLLLLPATAAMGATLPAGERILAADDPNRRVIGGLYAANTLGAVLGVLATTFVLFPAVGLSRAITVLAIANLICALVALGIVYRPAVETTATLEDPRWSRPRLIVALFITGLLGLGYEVVALRALSQVLENTIFTFANVLAVYLLGTALGAALYQKVQHNNPPRHLNRLLPGLAACVVLGCLLLSQLTPINQALLSRLGSGLAPAVAGEMLIAGAVFLPPTLLMGATFTHLASAAKPVFGLGRALALNTLGAALAPLVFGLLILPALGSLAALLVIVAGYLLLVPSWPRETVAAGLTTAAAALALFLSPLNLRALTVPDGGELLAYRDGVMASVAVVSDASGGRHLKLNNHYTMGGTATQFADRRQAHLPLLLHAEPADVLLLGIGTGATMKATLPHPDLSVTAVELVPEMWDLLDYFGISAEHLRKLGNYRLLTADARRFVRATKDQFDVIIADIFHPSRDGAAALYTREHFAAVRDRLRRGGLFCQWLPVYQLDLETLAIIAASFTEVFPDSHVTLAHFSLGQPVLGLLGYLEPPAYPEGYLRQRITDRALAEELMAMRLTSDYELFGGVLGTAPSLARILGDEVAVNTDDHPLVAFTAPNFVYGDPEPPGARLLALTGQLKPTPHEWVAATASEDFRQRLVDYWRARDAYLAAGVGVAPTNDLDVLLAQVATPLLRVVQTSKDFMPAYRPLLVMARDLHSGNPRASRSLLLALEQASPRPEARQLRIKLFAEEN